MGEQAGRSKPVRSNPPLCAQARHIARPGIDFLLTNLKESHAEGGAESLLISSHQFACMQAYKTQSNKWTHSMLNSSHMNIGAHRAMGSLRNAGRLCARPFSSSASGRNVLSGRNIFELKASASPQANAATAEVAETSGPCSNHKSQAGAGAAQEAFIPLPTSDESETLLRIRHSVSVLRGLCVLLVALTWANVG